MNAGATTEQWQTVPASPAPCACCTGKPGTYRFPDGTPQAAADKEFEQRFASMVPYSTEYRRLLNKWGKAEELALEWRSIAEAMRDVNVQLVAANRALVAEAQGLRVAA